MELKAGYKQTDAGVMPVDWSAQRLGDVADANWGNTSLTKTSYQDFGYQAFSAAGPDGFVERYEHEDPAVLLSAIGAQCGKTWLSGHKWTAIKNTIWIRGDGAVAETNFIFWITGRVEFWPRRGQAQPFISLGDVRNLKIPLPETIAEQSAIATALSDVDALLAAQDALIAKKRAIKQGSMQELLTGKRRLPGFSGEWEVKRLGEHLHFLGNGANSRAELMEDGRVRYLHYGDIHGSNDVLLNPAATAMPFLPEVKAVRLDRLRDGDLVFADASEDLDGVGKSVELQSVGKLEVVSGMHTIAVRFDKGVLADGFKAYLQFIPSFRNHLRRLASGTKVYATNMSHIASAEVKLPSPAEQAAISSVFTDMDAELTALEAQRAKTVQLKQGMMQALLTGRIRLV